MTFHSYIVIILKKLVQIQKQANSANIIFFHLNFQNNALRTFFIIVQCRNRIFVNLFSIAYAI